MSRTNNEIIKDYLRKEVMPHIWCPGCGNGIILGSLIRAIHKLGYNKNDIVLISGIGCSGRMSTYADFNTIHALHGRALTIATGIKLTKPNLKVIVVAGDGDSLAIGGNHFIHCARRNIDITFILVNNSIYGMTGGQYSPTSPKESKTATSPYNLIEKPFDTAKLAISAGACFVARDSVQNASMLSILMEKAIEKKRFFCCRGYFYLSCLFWKIQQIRQSNQYDEKN